MVDLLARLTQRCCDSAITVAAFVMLVEDVNASLQTSMPIFQLLSPCLIIERTTRQFCYF